MAREFFEFDKIKVDSSVHLKYLPKPLESIRTFQKLVREKLTWYLGSGFFEHMWRYYEGNYNCFPFTDESCRKSTERPDVPY